MWFYGKSGWYYIDAVNRVWLVQPDSGYPHITPIYHQDIRLHCKPVGRKPFWAFRAEKAASEIAENRRLSFIERESGDVVSR